MICSFIIIVTIREVTFITIIITLFGKFNNFNSLSRFHTGQYHYLIITAEEFIAFIASLRCIAGNMGIIVIVVTCYIPIVNFCTGRLSGIFIITFRETVVNDITVCGRCGEHEVSCCFKEVFIMSFIGSSFVDIVGIDITATFVLTNINKIHFYNTIDWSIVCLVNNLIVTIL